MKTYKLNDLNQDISNNNTNLRIDISEGFAVVSDYNLCDTEGYDEETSLMAEIRDLVDCNIPDLLEMVDIYRPSLNINQVVDNTPDNGPEYYYRVDETLLDEALKDMFNSGAHNLYAGVHPDRITDFMINDDLEVVIKEEA